jgi:hypothetical protein
VKRPADHYVIAGAVVAVVLLIGLVGAALSQPFVPAPVSNPGAGIDAPRLTPPPRFDWTDK